MLQLSLPGSLPDTRLERHNWDSGEAADTHGHLTTVPSPGTRPSLPDKLHEVDVLPAAVSPVPGMLFGTAKVLSTFFFFPQSKITPQKIRQGPRPVYRDVFKALTHLDLSHPGDRSGHVPEATR